MAESIRRIVLVGAVLVIAGCTCGSFGVFGTPTPSSTATDAPPTRTPTLLPGLKPTATQTHRETAEIVENLIRSNGGCDLPCWWGGGITLGETSIDDANAWMIANGLEMMSTSTSEFTIPEAGSDELYVASFDLKEQDGVVRSYTLHVRPFGDNPLRFVSVMADRYSWSHLLTTQGEPTIIFLDIYGTIRSNLDYQLLMVYEASGFYIQYSGSATALDDQTVEVCPRFEQLEGIRVEIVNPSYESISESIWVQLFSSYPPGVDKSLLAMTGVSVGSFTQEFKDRDSDTCLQVNYPK